MKQHVAYLFIPLCILKECYVRGLKLFEVCGAERVVKGVCRRWPLKV